MKFLVNVNWQIFCSLFQNVFNLTLESKMWCNTIALRFTEVTVNFFVDLCIRDSGGRFALDECECNSQIIT